MASAASATMAVAKRKYRRNIVLSPILLSPSRRADDVGATLVVAPFTDDVGRCKISPDRAPLIPSPTPSPAKRATTRVAPTAAMSEAPLVRALRLCDSGRRPRTFRLAEASN